MLHFPRDFMTHIVMLSGPFSAQNGAIVAEAFPHEEMYATVHTAITEFEPVSEDASFLGLKTIMSSGVFKTLSAFKAAIRAITTLEHDTQSPSLAVQTNETDTAMLKHKGVQQARAILSVVVWPGMRVALHQKRTSVRLAATVLELEQQTLQLHNLERVCSYRFGVILGVTLACTFFDDNALTYEVNMLLTDAQTDLGSGPPGSSSESGDTPTPPSDDDQTLKDIQEEVVFWTNIIN